MHKKLIKKGGSNTALKFQAGGWFSSFLNSGFGKSMGSLATGLTSGSPALPGGLGADGQKLTEGQLLNRSIGAGINGAFTGLLGLSNINQNQGLNSDQKRIAKGDLAVDTVGQVAGAFGPVGSAIGAGLGIVNKLGGMLMGTPKELKNFKVNDQVAGSSGYGGIANMAGQTADSANSYKSAGLFGKLFGGKKNLISKTKQSNEQQKQVQGLLDINNKAKNASLASSDMLATQSNNRLYNGGMWTNGSVLFGKEGTTINKYTQLAKASKSVNVKRFRTKIKELEVVEPEEIISVLEVEVKPIPTFQDGGPINIIVEGELHARKHDLKNVDELADAQITLKGVPVITKSEGGEIKQHAEVERDELILHYDLTKRLEELLKEDNEEATIQAGRILAKELVKNTKDSKRKILKNG